MSTEARWAEAGQSVGCSWISEFPWPLPWELEPVGGYVEGLGPR